MLRILSCLLAGPQGWATLYCAWKRREPAQSKTIYRWVQLREDMEPIWLVMGSRHPDGTSTRLGIPEVVWFDGRVTPGRNP